MRLSMRIDTHTHLNIFKILAFVQNQKCVNFYSREENETLF